MLFQHKHKYHSLHSKYTNEGPAKHTVVGKVNGATYHLGLMALRLYLCCLVENNLGILTGILIRCDFLD